MFCINSWWTNVHSESLANCNPVFFPPRLQVRSPTGVHGRAASGASHAAMSSPDTSGSTPEQSHSNAATATGERVEMTSSGRSAAMGKGFHNISCVMCHKLAQRYGSLGEGMRVKEGQWFRVETKVAAASSATLWLEL